jgi:hypothetical protein
VLDRELGILGGGDALEDERDVVLVLESLHLRPGKARLVRCARPGRSIDSLLIYRLST